MLLNDSEAPELVVEEDCWPLKGIWQPNALVPPQRVLPAMQVSLFQERHANVQLIVSAY